MLLTEWNWDDAKEVWQEEAFEVGEMIGETRGRKETALALLQDGLYSKEKIAEMTKLELTEVEALAMQLDKTE